MKPWTPGTLDIHHINTGRGDATLFIFPDGTTMLLDAGDLNLASPDNAGLQFAPPRPDDTRTPGQWITYYIRQALAHEAEPSLDYGIITHFHDDHCAAAPDGKRLSASGAYALTGITEVGDQLPIRCFLDRGWPDYDYPFSLVEWSEITNYRAFLRWQIANRGMRVERFEPGRNDQIRMVRDLSAWSDFEVRNVAANGVVWTGTGTATEAHFPPIADLQPRDIPDENLCSVAMRISYGKFSYFTGGDLHGIPQPGGQGWEDVETPVARALGLRSGSADVNGVAVNGVDVNVVNHHGYYLSENSYFLSMLRPRVHILSTWCVDHPGQSLTDRIMSTRLYSGPRDIFATNVMEPIQQVIAPATDAFKSTRGHILVRVEPGGKRYRVIVLDDTTITRDELAVHGPYESR